MRDGNSMQSRRPNFFDWSVLNLVFMILNHWKWLVEEPLERYLQCHKCLNLFFSMTDSLIEFIFPSVWLVIFSLLVFEISFNSGNSHLEMFERKILVVNHFEASVLPPFIEQIWKPASFYMKSSIICSKYFPNAFSFAVSK